MTTKRIKTDAPVVKNPTFIERAEYPWDAWTDGKARVLTQGVHFHVPPKFFSVAAYQHARRKGYCLQARVEGTKITVQFTKREKEPAAKAKPKKAKPRKVAAKA